MTITFVKQIPVGYGNALVCRVNLLNNISIDECPKEFSDTSSFQFFQSKEATEPGQPLDTTSAEFKTEMQLFVDALWKQLNDFQNEQSAGTGQTQEKTGVNKI